jgi:hypothetical protein
MRPIQPHWTHPAIQAVLILIYVPHFCILLTKIKNFHANPIVEVTRPRLTVPSAAAAPARCPFSF